MDWKFVSVKMTCLVCLVYRSYGPLIKISAFSEKSDTQI
jgi:hypothetical protein